jgi:hypothetical protein
MDVRQRDGARALVAEAREEHVERRRGSGVHEHAVDQPGADDVPAAEVEDIDDPRFRGPA